MNRRLLHLLALLVFLLVQVSVAQAQTLNATFNTATDVPMTASGYTASGTVNFTLNFAPATGTVLTVVNNTGLNFIQGAFSNLAQGQAVTLSFNGATYNFVANYYGGTGNDLVLVWANNRVMAWGGNDQNELGNSTAGNSPVPSFVTTAGTPLAGKTVLSTSAGWHCSIALCSDGSLAAWGYNGWGQLGNGSTTGLPPAAPVAVTQTGVLAGKTVIAVSEGRHFCLALCSDGTVASWGENNLGQLGNGNTTNSSLPGLVDNSADSALLGKTVVAIAAGMDFAVALCSDGTLTSWGTNQSGELGLGFSPTNPNPGGSSSVPVAVDMTPDSALFGKTVTAIATGSNHTLALCSDGTVVAWGGNNFGQLGGVPVDRSALVTVDTTSDSALFGKTVIAIAAGLNHSVALCSDGTVTAWGADSNGQLGNASNTDAYTPVAVNQTGVLFGKTVTSITAGQTHTLALCSDGTLFSWGQNSEGQLGNNSLTDSNVPVAVNTSTRTAGEVFGQISSGENAFHNFAIVAEPIIPKIAVQEPAGTNLSSGVGTISFGPSAIGSGAPLTFTILNNGMAPLQITGMIFDGVNASDFSVTTPPGSTVAPGGSTTMVVTFKPSASFDRFGTLHLSSNDPNTGSFNVNLFGYSPSLVSATFSSVASVPMTVSTLTATGSTVNLSLNFTPPTGTNLTVVNNTSSGFIQGVFSNLAQGQLVTLNFGGLNYTFVANYYGGTGNDLVLQWAHQRVLTWGLNNSGQLGDGTVTSRTTPVPVNTSAGSALSGKTLLQVATGYQFSMGLCSDGTLAAWGYNSDSELGNNSTTNSSLPVTVDASADSALHGKTVISVCGGNTFAMALCSDGTVAAWGNGQWGQLANGTGLGSAVPVAVSTASSSALHGKTVVQIAAGNWFAMALCSDGTVVTWGYNQDGELGQGNTISSYALPPVAVDTALGSALNGRTVVSIAAGYTQAYALCSDGTLAAWGYNADGELGNNSTTKSTLPVSVVTAGTPLAGKTISKISAGGFHVLALCTDGTLAAWGSNTYGQLGNNSTINSSIPTAVTMSGTPLAGKTVIGVSAANTHSLAWCADGTVAAWGYNIYGELGTNTFTNSSVPVAVSPAPLGAGEYLVQSGGSSTSLSNNCLFADPIIPLMAVQQPAGSGLTNGSGTVDFGTTTLGSGVPLTFTILNNGVAPMTISGVTIDGANSADFTVTTPPSTSVGIGSSTTMVVTFSPSSSFVRTATLHLGSNDPNANPFNIALTGSSTGALSASFTSATSVALTTGRFVATGSTVNLSLNYAPAVGAGLTVVNNTGPGYIQGTFSNLAQGQNVPLTFGGVVYNFVANYYGGTGNDLVLQWANTRLMAWGFGPSGQLGNGTGSDSLVPDPVDMTGVLAGKTVIAVAAGGAFSLALCSDGTVASWGSNQFGQLGNNSTHISAVPVAVVTAGTALAGKTVIAIGAGQNHSVALCSDGTVAAWGYNGDEELGNGTAVNSSVPVAVSTGSNSALAGKFVTGIAVGPIHSLALCSDGTVVGWGHNGSGELGNGIGNATNVPVAVATMATALYGKTVTKVAAGFDFSLALCSDGTLTAWGVNSNWQLGSSNPTFSSTVPLALPTAGTALAGKAILSISAGGGYGLAVCSDGTLAEWGYNNEGELGNGNTNFPLPPVSVITSGVLFGKTVTTLSGGNIHTLALCSDGTAVAWGSGLNGRRGDGVTTGSTVPVLTSTSTLAPGEIFMCSVTSPIAAHSLGIVASPPVTTGIQNWRNQTFGANASNPTISGDNADPNGNGIPNLMEYALHGDAMGNTTGASILPQTSSNPTTDVLQLSFTRYPDRTDITLIVQANDSLTGNWTNLAQSVNGAPFTVITTGATVNESGSGNALSVTVGDLYQMTDPNHPHRFMRLQVTRP